MAIDSQWSKVVLLLPFEGANGATSIVDVKGRVVRAYGNAKISTDQYPSGCSSSAKFDGNNDYLTVSHPDLALGTGDFDIDFLLYKAGETTTGAANVANIIDFRASDPSVAIQIAVDGGSGSIGANKVYLYVNGTVRITGTTAMTTSFKRITLSRVSGVTRLFVNGVQEGSSYTDTNNYSQTTVTIGGRFAATSGDYRSLNGYLGPIRITKHGRGHSTAFTPDSIPFTRPTITGVVLDDTAAPVAKTITVRDRSTQVYLGGANSDPTTGIYTFYPKDFGEVQVARVDELFDPMTYECIFNLDPTTGPPGGWLNHDSTGRALVFNGNALISSTGTSITFDGSGDYVASTSTTYIIGLDDFSIEVVFTPTAGGHGGTYSRILQLGPNITAGTLAIYSTNNYNPMQLDAQFYDTSWHGLWTYNSATLANDVPHYLQLRRINGVFTAYIDGVLWGTSATLAYDITGTQLAIGSNTTGGESFNGLIGPVRISRGPRRAAQIVPSTNFLTGPADGSSGENALIYDRVIPG